MYFMDEIILKKASYHLYFMDYFKHFPEYQYLSLFRIERGSSEIIYRSHRSLYVL